MGKVMVKKVYIPEDEERLTSEHYDRMGFELLTSNLCTVRNEAGAVIRKYYENIYKFDYADNNAEQRWKIYKEYKAKKRELERANSESEGGYVPTKALLILGIIFSIIAFPFVPMFFGNEFGEFVTWKIGLLSSYQSFDTVIFVGALFLAPIIGGLLALFVNLIQYAFSRKRKLLKAIDRIPVLRKEIEELTYKAQSLKNQ